MYRLSNMFISTTFNMLENYGLEITENNMQEILNYLTNIYNNTRIWSNNSLTPIEMIKEYKKEFDFKHHIIRIVPILEIMKLI